MSAEQGHEASRALYARAWGIFLYTPVVEIPAQEVRDRFQKQALAAVDRLLRSGSPS
jgi:hypothetical protein